MNLPKLANFGPWQQGLPLIQPHNVWYQWKAKHVIFLNTIFPYKNKNNQDLHSYINGDPVFQIYICWLATLGHMTEPRVFIGLDSSFHQRKPCWILFTFTQRSLKSSSAVQYFEFYKTTKLNLSTVWSWIKGELIVIYIQSIYDT